MAYHQDSDDDEPVLVRSDAGDDAPTTTTESTRKRRVRDDYYDDHGDVDEDDKDDDKVDEDSDDRNWIANSDDEDVINENAQRDASESEEDEEDESDSDSDDDDDDDAAKDDKAKSGDDDDSDTDEKAETKEQSDSGSSSSSSSDSDGYGTSEVVCDICGMHYDCVRCPYDTKHGRLLRKAGIDPLKVDRMNCDVCGKWHSIYTRCPETNESVQRRIRRALRRLAEKHGLGKKKKATDVPPAAAAAAAAPAASAAAAAAAEDMGEMKTPPPRVRARAPPAVRKLAVSSNGSRRSAAAQESSSAPVPPARASLNAALLQSAMRQPRPSKQRRVEARARCLTPDSPPPMVPPSPPSADDYAAVRDQVSLPDPPPPRLSQRTHADAVPLPVSCGICNTALDTSVARALSICDVIGIANDGGVSASDYASAVSGAARAFDAKATGGSVTQRLPCGHAVHARCLVSDASHGGRPRTCVACNGMYTEYDTYGHVGPGHRASVQHARAAACQACGDPIASTRIAVAPDGCDHVFHRTCLVIAVLAEGKDFCARGCPICDEPACTFEVLMPEDPVRQRMVTAAVAFNAVVDEYLSALAECETDVAEFAAARAPGDQAGAKRATETHARVLAARTVCHHRFRSQRIANAMKQFHADYDEAVAASRRVVLARHAAPSSN